MVERDYDMDLTAPKEGVDMSNDEGRHFKKEPSINVISKEEFEERVEKVFHLLWKTLAKSFGPYGAPTLIYNYPWRHVTKDGYTIMKNLSMDASETKVDQAIADMAGDICGRLNYSVGDGTTSAVIATNSIYQNYRAHRDELDAQFVLPRDVISKYEAIKTEIIQKLQDKVKQIRTEDMEQLKKNIYDVVYISSNADTTISEYISTLYKEIGAPGISCALAPDGITKMNLINGYKFNTTLTDRIYVNNDNGTMDIRDTDVIIFSTKVTKNTYTKILKPLNTECMTRGRHLLVCAPTYDEMALQQVISVDLNNEYKKRHEVNMILTSYRAISAHTRQLVNDFSILMNTTIIDRSLEEAIFNHLDSGKPIFQVFNIDEREINDIRCLALTGEKDSDNRAYTYVYGRDELLKGSKPLSEFFPLVENYIQLGFVKEATIGLKENTSLFTGIIYDENRYQAALKDAEIDLKEKEEKYQKLGTFNLEVSQAQERYYALKLKMGVIEVGADSELSAKMLKDSVDDAIRAASSAFNHGVVLGCNTNLIQVIFDLYNNTEDDVDKSLINILLHGFMDVYRTVLSNAFEDNLYSVNSMNILPYMNGQNSIALDQAAEAVEKFFVNKKRYEGDVFTNKEMLEKAIKQSLSDSESGSAMSIHDVIIYYSIFTNQVFDVSKLHFTNDVINSCQTDEEILKATIDLITLLIVGNQMVVTQKHNF